MDELISDASDGATVRVARLVDATIVTLTGEIDALNAERVLADLDASITAGTDHVVFDLSSLEFMDSSGIAVLLAIARRVGEVSVRNPTNVIRRVIAVSGIADVLRVEP